MPGALEREIETIDAELARQHDSSRRKQKETATVTARYDADKQRWRELRSGEPAAAVVATERRPVIRRRTPGRR